MGLHNYTVKIISESGENYRHHLANLWMSKFILIGLFILLMTIAILIKKLSAIHAFLFFLIALEMLTYSLFQFLRCFAQGLQKFKMDSFLSIFDRILLIFLGGSILILFHSNGQISLPIYIAFHIVAYLFCFVLVAYYLRKELSFSVHHVSFIQLEQIVKNGYPLIIIVFLMSIYTRIDAVLLEHMVPNGNEQCGILAYSHRIIDSAYNALSLFGIFLLPTVAKQYTENKKSVKKIVAASFAICTIITFIFFISCHLGSHLIYMKLYHTSDKIAIDVFKTQLWTVIGVGWMYVFGSFLTAIGKFLQLIIIVFIGVILSVTLNFLWIPSYGVQGAANASAIVQTTMGFMHFVVAVYYLYLKK
jgi:O-antigen/teichoic acid export membrane protein